MHAGKSNIQRIADGAEVLGRHALIARVTGTSLVGLLSVV